MKQPDKFPYRIVLDRFVLEYTGSQGHGTPSGHKGVSISMQAGIDDVFNQMFQFIMNKTGNRFDASEVIHSLLDIEDLIEQQMLRISQEAFIRASENQRGK